MKLQKIYFIFPLFALLSCNNEAEDFGNEIDIPKKTLKDKSLVIGDPFDYGVDGTLIFPIGSNYTPKMYEKPKTIQSNMLSSNAVGFTYNLTDRYDAQADVEYINVKSKEFDIRNLLFHNLNTGKSYPLTNDTIHILSFSLHKELDNPLIFYRVVKEDYNNDSLYTNEDGVMMYCSNLDGSNFKQLTPNNQHYVSYTKYPVQSKILVKTILDSDRDTTFSEFDETNFVEVYLKNPGMGKSIFKQSLKDSIKKLIQVD